MSERRSFYRKIAYGIGIIVLLFPIFWLSSPATSTEAGGKLAELRNEHRLGQANLGEIDPASETMKLATLGLRGVAVNLLWEKANYYKKTEDWTNLTATLEQLAKLQPNFTTFWRFQAWNLSYNVSVEFDDYRDRYYYVRRGIDFLKEGEKYNENSPRLLWDLGWFIGQKIGRADEHVQYRELFKNDDDFHPEDRPPAERDNWLVGKEWYLKAVDAVDNKGMSLGKQSPRIFYSSPAMSQINYAEAIEEEGAFETARRAWIRADEEWGAFGEIPIEHSTGVKLQLGREAELKKRVDDLRKELEGLAPGLRDKISQERLAALTAEERKLYDIPIAELPAEQHAARQEVDAKLAVTDRDLAERIAHDQPANEKQALQLAHDLEREDRQLRFTINYKRDSNYNYWQTRCDFEQTANALEARRLMFEAHKIFREEQNSPKAKELYVRGFAKWRQVLDEFPTILGDETTTGDDLLEYVKKYREVLDTLNETIPADFPLWDVIETSDREQLFTEELKAHQESLAKEKESAPTESPATESPATQDDASDDSPNDPTEQEAAPAADGATPPATESDGAAPTPSDAAAQVQSAETPPADSTPAESAE